jgi:phage-related protein
MAGGALSAGTVSLGVKPDATGFGASLSKAVSGETSGIAAALGGSLVTGLKLFAAPLAALAAGLSIKHLVDDSTKAFEDMASSVKTLGRLTGGTTAQVSGLRGAMQLGGLDADAATGAITIFSKNLGNAAGDASKTADLVAKLGGSFQDAAGNVKPMSEILPGLADKFKTMPDGAEKTALAVQLFGRSGAQMVPFLNRGSEGISDLTAKAKDMGLVLDDTSMKTFVDAKVAARNYNASIQGLKVTLGGELIPVLDSVQNIFRNIITPVILFATHTLAAHREEFLKVADGIDVQGVRIKDAITGIFNLVVRGNFTGGLGKALGLEEDSPIVGVVLTMRDNVLSMFDSIKSAAGTAFATLGPILAPLIPQVIALASSLSPVHVIFTALAPLLPQLVSLLGGLAVTLASSLGAALTQLLPPLTQLAGQLAADLSGAVVALLPSVAQLAGVLAGVLTGALTFLVPLLTNVAQWMTENGHIVIGAIAAYAGFQIVTGIMATVSAVTAGYAAASYGAAGATYAAGAAAKIGAIAYGIQNSALGVSLAAWWANTAAVGANEALSLSSKVAIIGSSIAMGVATAAQWAWNLAMDANPIGIIIVAIGALVAGIIWVATQTTFFQDAWKVAVDVVGTAWNWLWTVVLLPVFTAIGAIFTWVFNSIIVPIVTGIQIYVGIWAAIFTWLYAIILYPIFTALGVIFNWLWNSVIMPVVGFISASITVLGGVFSWLYTNIVQPYFNAIGAVFSWVWNSVISPVAGFITGAVNTIGSVIGTIFGNIGGVIRGAFNGVVDFVKGIFNNVIGFVNGMIDGINGIAGLANAVPGVHIDQIGHLPRLADGATVLPRAGGTPVILGEAGKAESVVDTGKLNKRLDEDGGGGKGATFNVYEAVSAMATAMQVNRIQAAGVA